ncbi:putative pumilio homolog 10 [Eutrema salsugineum]|uniref:putative pumilio homolog 10 n=1 Tax=Eutrema salsugineum TaxID=72664 RepID=UPI000CED5053|nr:putative pumilio homolog 10 [Eutrema salsugineum]
MFDDKFMGFGGFHHHGDFNIQRADSERPYSDRRLPDGFLQNLDTNPFLKNQSYNNSDMVDNGLDLCKKLNKMGISCDMSIWSRPDPVDFGSRRTLHGFSSGFDRNLCGGGASNISSGFLRKSSSHGLSQGELRLLGFQDSFNPNGFREMMTQKNQRDFLFDHMNRPIKRSSPCIRAVSLGNDAFMGSLMFEGNRVSRALNTMEASYPEVSLGKDALMFEANRVSRALDAMEGPKACYPENRLPLDLASMVNIYGSVNLMAKDQIGCRVLQKLVDERKILAAIFFETIDHVVELSMDPFGNYIVQKLLLVCDEEQRTLIMSVLTSNPVELIKICLNNYGTRVVQKMIETVKTKQQIGMIKSGLKSEFVALAKDLNGYHVIQTCLDSLGPNDKKFVLEAATKYCAEIATHRHGCFVLQCCVSNSLGEQRERLVDEISRNSRHLSQDPFGNYVVQFLIEQKVSSVKLLIQFRMHYAELATQKFSSHVMEKCLRQYPQSRAEIVRELLSVPNFEHILQDPYGNYVIQTALSVTKGHVRARLVEKVSRFGILKWSPYCKKIFSRTFLKK